MTERYRKWFWLALAILASRLVTMAIVPLADTTEPRYAEIARLMVATGDWITPWFEPGVPFWGKPPLSFWAQALSMQWLGVNEWAARLPSWIAIALTAFLVARLAFRLWGKEAGTFAALIFASMSLSFISAGAVMTDPFLLLGTTLSLAGFATVMFTDARGGAARWLFFVGLVIGLLAKGPLALVLVGLPIGIWTVWGNHWRAVWRALPWWRGTLLTLVLALPWYIAAEIKTPGFLDYFIVGEHFRRFLDPGWQGDLYGNGHSEPHGKIWLMWLWASFPWGLVLLGTGFLARGRKTLRTELYDSSCGRFLLLSAIAPMLFFTLSGNILWTYVLPGLPFVALMLARVLLKMGEGASEQRSGMRWSGAMAAVVPVLALGAGVYAMINTDAIKTEKPLVAQYRLERTSPHSPLVYWGEVPFSARFYLREQVATVDEQEIQALMSHGTPFFLGIRPNHLDEVKPWLGEAKVTLRYKGNRHALLEVDPKSGGEAVAIKEKAVEGDGSS
ncbi:glycosyltransferase family 39 protein [Marinobacteraceae bacterium S3BR75-40.1]